MRAFSKLLSVGSDVLRSPKGTVSSAVITGSFISSLFLFLLIVDSSSSISCFISSKRSFTASFSSLSFENSANVKIIQLFSGVASSISEGDNIHIFVFCIINSF